MQEKRGINIALIVLASLLVLAVVLFVARAQKVGTKAAWKEISPFQRLKDVVNYVFTKEQELFLKDLHQDAQSEFRKLIRDIETKTDYKVIITSGYRSWQKQAELDEENRKNADPGNSYHNYGMAIDINAVKPKSALRKATSKAKWEASGIPDIIRKAGFRWGGDFSSYHDPVHIDLPLAPVSQLKQYAQLQFGSDWNQVKGNQVIF